MIARTRDLRGLRRAMWSAGGRFLPLNAPCGRENQHTRRTPLIPSLRISTGYDRRIQPRTVRQPSAFTLFACPWYIWAYAEGHDQPPGHFPAYGFQQAKPVLLGSILLISKNFFCEPSIHRPVRCKSVYAIIQINSKKRKKKYLFP